MLRKFRKQKESAAPEATIDLNLLEEHLNCIKVSLLEIRGFRKKKIVKSPTVHFMKRIDLEEAWPSCRDTLHETFRQLCYVAQLFEVEFEAMPASASFGSAIDQSVNLIDRIMLFLETTGNLTILSSDLQTIDACILKIQQFTNALQKHVMADFVFTRTPLE